MPGGLPFFTGAGVNQNKAPLMYLEQGPVYTALRPGSMSAKQVYDAHAIVRQATSARPSGYEYMPRYKNGRWDGYIRLFRNNQFPSGLCSFVIEALSNAGYSVGVEQYDPGEQWQDGVVGPTMFTGIRLRHYQLHAIKTLMAYERGVAKMATNAGKTVIIAALAKAHLGRVLVLVTKKDLMYQTSERLSQRLDEPVGCVGDGKNVWERVTVGMVQTLVRRLDQSVTKMALSGIGCVMFDECHHIPSKTAQYVMCSIPAPVRFGFSGTPLSHQSLDDLVLIGATGPVVVEVTNADLIEQGVSAKPVVSMYKVESQDHADDKYAQAYKACIVENYERNDIIAEQVGRRQAASALILVDRIAHGDVIARLIPGARFVNGSHSIEKRLEALNGLRQGNGRVVISTPIFDEGVDIPAVDLLVLAGGGKGHRKLLQRIGRGMRQKEGPNTLHVIDFADLTNKYLADHSRARWMLYKLEGFDVEYVE